MNLGETLLNKALACLANRDYKHAHQYCVQVIQQLGPHAHAYFLLGIIHIEIGQIDKAIALFDTSNDIEKRPLTFAYMAKCYALKGDMQQALDCVEMAPVDSLSRALDLDTVGVSLSRVGLHDKAKPYFDKALRLEPDNPQYNYNYAVSSKFAGTFKLARRHFEKAISLAPDFYQAHFALSDLGTSGIDDHCMSENTAPQKRLQQLTALAANVENNPDARLHIGHALAKEYDTLGEYERAFKSLQHAKAPHRERSVAALKDYQSILETLKQNLHIQTAKSTQTSTAPIFVVGMPRSGTTLVERILSHHSDVASGGELQDFGVAVKQIAGTDSQLVLDKPTIEKAYRSNLSAIGERYLKRTAFLRQGHKHLVDKLPFNFFYVDLIRRALPNAKIICLQRNAMDTCVGNFRQLFSINSPYYAYAYDLEVVGQLYLGFNEWINHFADAYPESIHVQCYEELAKNPEQEVKKMLAFCALPWEAQCLQVQDNTLPVSTASKVQVREPINTKSIGRWKRYDSQLDKLKAIIE